MTSFTIRSPWGGCVWPLCSSHLAVAGNEEHLQQFSPKNIGKCLIIIPYQNRLSYPHNGGAEIARRPEHQPGQDIVCWRRALQIKRGHFLAFSSNEAMRHTRHSQCLCPSELPTGRHRFAYRNTPCLQKPGGFCTGRSALAVIIPVNVGCHIFPFMPL